MRSTARLLYLELTCFVYKKKKIEIFVAQVPVRLFCTTHVKTHSMVIYGLLTGLDKVELASMNKAELASI